MSGVTDLTKAIKGAGTGFWRLKDGEDETSLTYADYLADDKWEKLAGLKEITPNEITVADEDDSRLDDDDAEWTKTTPGQKTPGETSLVLEWKPGELGQQKLIADVNNGVTTVYRSKYPNGAVDAFRGYINQLGKTVTINEKMTRTVKFMQVGKPIIAEDLIVQQANAGA
ncbi:phage tail tube protein [Vibrio sp. H11]|uniref:phage tail tube protein n=1 Tax=Vibrio sp. H11 TaxID=2565928 RepID=UPI0010A6226E|nr:phage tail tube protein [Vibrio sp. H11]